MTNLQRSFIDVGIHGDHLVAIGDDGSIWLRDEGEWEHLPGIVQTGKVACVILAAAHHGPAADLVLLTSTDGRGALVMKEGAGWKSLGAPPANRAEKRGRNIIGISCFGGSLACACDDGSIWQLVAGIWVEIPGPPRQ